MALLDFFLFLKNKNNLNILVVHVNHLLRDKESDQDETFVKSWCEYYPVSCKILREDTRKKALEKKCSIEEMARIIRYEFLNSIAIRNKARILTAHTLSDNAETFLLNLIRGSSSTGLSGIPIERNRIIRPFLFFKKKDTINYCKNYEVEFITDSSNLSRDYKRNKLRLDVVPEFKKLNPKFEEIIFRTSNYLKEDNKFLFTLAKEKLEKLRINSGFLSDGLCNLSDSLFFRCSVLIVQELFNLTPNYPQLNMIRAIIKKRCGKVIFSNNKILVLDTGVLKKFTKNKAASWKIPCSEGTFLTPDSRHIIMKKLNVGDAFDPKLDLDFNLLGGSFFRNRRPGDLFSENFRGVTKTLKKLLNEKKIPNTQRSNLIILANKNKVLWLEGFGASRGAAANKNSILRARVFID
jgi:tRNA(Ile)-lysidine synthase